MHAQFFTYALDLDSQVAYFLKFVDPFAEAVARAKGLVSKVWMADFGTKYASFYLWESKEAMDVFMALPVIKDVGKLPFLKDLVITDYPVVEAASRITRGVI